MVNVTVNFDDSKLGVIEPSMLVKHKVTEEVGIVTSVTNKWVHVTWLAAMVHNNSHHRRSELQICPVGTRVVMKQRG